jgi:hypothetical protein
MLLTIRCEFAIQFTVHLTHTHLSYTVLRVLYTGMLLCIWVNYFLVGYPMQCNLGHQAQQALQHSFLDTGVEHIIIVLLP